MESDEDWAAAEAGLKTALDQLGMEYEVNEGDGAFYGPKIDFHLQDSMDVLSYRRCPTAPFSMMA